ncbi:MAG TPA: phosphatase PAP2 family protein [Sphingomicrobium sp.]|nr:phosphatase PAP2 family protein [Sphingomicrobium sp.]
MTTKTSRKLEQAAAKVTEADASVTDGFREHREGWPMRLLGAVSDAGDQPQLRVISGVTFAAGLLTRDPRLIRAGVRMLLAHELATAAKNFVKRRVDRTRPRSAGGRKQASPRPGRHQSKEMTSFPSGHTAGSVAVARAFARELPDHRTAALAAAGFVALAQIPRCAHYPSDVGAGAIIGAGAEALLAQVWPAETETIPSTRPQPLPLA